MQLETIKKKEKELTETINKAKARRAEWVENTKGRLFTTLIIIKESTDIGLYVETDETYKNLTGEYVKNQEYVCLSFQKRHTGVTEVNETNKTSHSYFVNGGYLQYAQSFTGMVWTIIRYPFIEGLVEEIESLTIDWYEPQEITEELILGHVEKFLDEMLKWENNHFRNQVGFSVSK